MLLASQPQGNMNFLASTLDKELVPLLSFIQARFVDNLWTLYDSIVIARLGNDRCRDKTSYKKIARLSNEFRG